MENNNGLSKYSLSNFTMNKSNEDFEDTIKYENTDIRLSGNIFEDIILSIDERKRMTANCKVIQMACYYVGFDDKYEYLKNIEKLNNKLSTLTDIYVYFDRIIPIMPDTYITNEISDLFRENDTRIGNDDINKFIEKENIYNITNDSSINRLFKEIFIKIIKEYIEHEPGVNRSKVKNFSIKILSWSKKYISHLYKNKITENNPKVIYYGSIKKHESYFIKMLYILGTDILILDPLGMSEWTNVDKERKYALVYEGKIKENIIEDPFKKINSEAVNNANKDNLEMNQARSITKSEDMLSVTLKRTIDIFKDIKLRVIDRGGRIEGRNPVIPVYFYRYIGIGEGKDAEAEYNNEIYLLDKELENSRCNYVKFIDQIEPPQNNEVAIIGNVIVNIFKKITSLDLETIFSEIKRNKLLPQVRSKRITDTLEYSFKEILSMYLQKEETSLTKTKNFLAKFLIWINRYSKILFNGINDDSFLDINPKILYFGELKYTEVYTLIFFSRVGCDILYINSNFKGDEIFLLIDKEEQYTKLQKNSNSIEGFIFPTEEKILRKSTVAYEASDEVEHLLFTPDSGLYKPWQFQRCNTLPVTLKSTFDEIAILWEEQARVRPNFKIANNTVYVPNIFTKINGTYEEIDKYWEFANKLKAAPNTYLIKEVPFATNDFTREDLFSLAYVINNDGNADVEKIVKSNFYKYSYLNEFTQKLILQKLNELIKCDYFCNKVDNKFKLKIIFTVLNLPEEIVKLIQNYDFPFEIPKIIIYANSRIDFSEEDIITILLLNIIGMDIVILTPTGYNNIENHIKGSLFDTHQLPSYKPDLQFNEAQIKKDIKSFFSKMFK